MVAAIKSIFIHEIGYIEQGVHVHVVITSTDELSTYRQSLLSLSLRYVDIVAR